jgi:hypothetical protein
MQFIFRLIIKPLEYLSNTSPIFSLPLTNKTLQYKQVTLVTVYLIRPYQFTTTKQLYYTV